EEIRIWKMEEMKETLTKFEATLSTLLGQMANVKEDIKNVSQKVIELEGDRERDSQVAPQPKPLTPARTEYELKEISRLTDCVKELQIFEGESGSYDSWIGRAEAVLKDYEIIKDRHLYRSIVLSIRQKIRGNAETTLLSYNVPDDDWPEIKRVLSLHYADRRDLRTLEHQMGQMTKGAKKNDSLTITPGIKIPLLARESHNIYSLIDDQHPEEAKKSLDALIKEYSTIFDPLSPGEAVDTCVRAEIRTSTQEPIYSKSYPYPFNMRMGRSN
ncbi:hypothetical protein KR084_006477, partial [Drosophila pseudotakahashii]